MRILVSSAVFAIAQLFLVLSVLGYEKLFHKRADNVRSRKPIPPGTLVLVYGLCIGALACLGNMRGDAAGVMFVDRVLSAFLTFGVGIPLMATIGLLLQRRFGLPAMGQLAGCMFGAFGGASVLVRPLLLHFGHSYYVWWLNL